MLKLWAYVLAYPYLVMFSLMVLEGPLAMVTSGMLVAAGAMSFVVAALLAVVADVGADTAYFFAGRLARRSTSNGRITRLLARLGATGANGGTGSRRRCTAAWPASCSAPRSSTPRRSR